jgi:hypothetical protein
LPTVTDEAALVELLLGLITIFGRFELELPMNALVFASIAATILATVERSLYRLRGTVEATKQTSSLLPVSLKHFD